MVWQSVVRREGLTVVRAEQKPGRRRAEPTRKLRRPARAPKPAEPRSDASRSETSSPRTPSAATPGTKAPKPASPAKRLETRGPVDRRGRERSPAALPRRVKSRRPKKQGRTGLRRRLLVALWLLLLLAAVVGVVLPWTPVDVVDAVPLAGAVGVTTLFTHGLAVRTGGRALIAGGLALVLATVAVVTQSQVLLAGAAVGTAVVSAVVAVLSTTPAARFSRVVREVGLAAVVASVGAFAVRAYGAEVSVERTSYLALGFSLLGALVLVYRLGAGLQGLGRRGFVMIVSGVAVLTVTLAYTEALARWGSPDMVSGVNDAFEMVRDAIGAVPRPIDVLLAFPALAWGVSTRARRRQGWWVTAFGAPGLAVVAVSLVEPGASLVEAGLSVLYSLVLGLAVGYAVIRADLFLTGARGRRARRLEELAAHRPEPGRLQPLL